MNRITQKMMAFYKLWQNRQDRPDYFAPTWEFVGEMNIIELGKWVLMSYKCPTRLTDIYQDNPDLLQRKLVKGRSGSEYYAYRIAPDASPALIKDKTLLKFYKLIKSRS